MCIRFYLLKMPKMMPGGPQEGLKRPQEDPKGSPGEPRTGPRWSQEGSKKLEDRSQTAQIASQGVLDDPRASQ